MFGRDGYTQCLLSVNMFFTQLWAIKCFCKKKCFIVFT